MRNRNAIMAAVVLALLVGSPFLAGAASAGDVDFGPLNALVVYGGISVVFGIVLLVLAFTVKMRAWLKVLAILLAVVLLAVPIIAWLLPSAPPAGNGNGDGPSQMTEWVSTVPTTVQGGGRDANTEVFGDAFAACNAGDTPAGTLDASGTNMFVSRENKMVQFQITMDDDIAITDATFSVPDCHSNDFFSRPKAALDENKDGNADNQLLYARLRSLGRTTVQDTNLSTTSFTYYDTTGGWYYMYMQEDADQAGEGTWVTACPTNAFKSPALDVNDCNEWAYIGDSTGAGFYWGFGWKFRGSYPPWYYTNGAVGDSFTITVDIGTPYHYDTWNYVVALTIRT